MPKSRIRAAWVMRMLVSRRSAVSAPRNLRQRDMDRDRHDAQCVRGQHHHDPVNAGKGGQVFGVTGIGKVRAVLQRLLVDRAGAERRGRTRSHQIHTARDDVDNTLGMARVGLAGGGGARERMTQNRQRAGHHARRLRRIGDFGPDGPVRQVRRIADPEERKRVLQRGPGLDGNLRADAGRFADRQRKGHGYLMIASARSSAR